MRFFLLWEAKGEKMMFINNLYERVAMQVIIKHWLKGPYTLIGPDGTSETKKERVPYKWLSGDVVNATTGDVVLRERSKISLVGIVDFLNRTGYGFTSRGVPLYMFHPLDASYPPMIVSSKTKPDTNMIIVATFEHWDEKWPRAGICKTLGPVGDKKVERDALFQRALGASCAAAGIADVEETYTACVEGYEVIDWDAVFNIDPEGCVDVDDILFWKKKEDKTTLFGIGIADVAAWVAEGSETDKRAAALGQTLYVDGTVHTPMLPTILSADRASLRSDGVARPVLALLFTIRHGKVLGRRWARLMIANKQTYDYKAYPLRLNFELRGRIHAFLSAAVGRDVGYDSHNWIEHAMVLYNHAAAVVLQSAGSGILRSHAGTTDTEYKRIADRTGIKELAWLGSAAGKYIVGTTETAHAGLNLDVYCHCSSPLRRYADLVNQRWLHHLLFGAPRPGVALAPAAAHLNVRNAAAKALDRDLWFLEHINTDRITESIGVVVRVRPESLTVYVPQWRRLLRAKGEPSLGLGNYTKIRTFCNLRATSWSERVVCNASYTNVRKLTL